MEEKKPINQFEYQSKKNGGEAHVSRTIKDWLDNQSSQAKASATEYTATLRDMFSHELLIEKFDGLPNGDERYHDDITDAYDRLRTMYEYNYDQLIEGDHLSKIQQEYGFD